MWGSVCCSRTRFRFQKQTAQSNRSEPNPIDLRLFWLFRGKKVCESFREANEICLFPKQVCRHDIYAHEFMAHQSYVYRRHRCIVYMADGDKHKKKNEVLAARALTSCARGISSKTKHMHAALYI